MDTLYAFGHTIQLIVENTYTKSFLSAEMVSRLIISLFAAFFLVTGMRQARRQETAFNPDLGQSRYVPSWSPTLLPFVTFFSMAVDWLLNKEQASPVNYFDALFGIFLHLCIYYLFLLLTLPFFRKRFHARTCAELWLLPNVLYLASYGLSEAQKPLVLIPVPNLNLSLIAGIWFVGFWSVLLWKIISHLRFRKAILLHAAPVETPELLALWKNEQADARVSKKPYPLLHSPDVVTPLSIGFFKRTRCVILPKYMVDACPYTDEEMALILRHELIHIGRANIETKFFMVFCTALCWFNPLMWIAMRRSSDDLELSCDEATLLDVDAASRKRYAQILLRTAGDNRGFTTCLSASAESLKYRLSNVVVPKKRKLGTAMAGFLLFILFSTYGYVALAYNGGTGHQYLFDSLPLSEFEVTDVRVIDQDVSQTYVIQDSDAVLEYLAALPLSRLTGSYSFSDPEHNRAFVFEGPKGMHAVTMEDQRVNVLFLYDREPEAVVYYCLEPIDWDFIESLTSIEWTGLGVINPFPPELYLYHESNSGKPQGVTVVTGSILNRQMLEPESSADTIQEDSTFKAPIDDEWNYDETNCEKPGSDEPIILQAANDDCVKLRFSHPLHSEHIVVTIENWDRSSSRTLYTESDLRLIGRTKTHYTVHADLLVDGIVYSMEYHFDADKE